MDEKKKEDLRKKAATVGVAATLATAGLPGVTLNAGEKDAAPSIGYVQEVDNSRELKSSDFPGASDVFKEQDNYSTELIDDNPSLKVFDFLGEDATKNDSSIFNRSIVNETDTFVPSRVNSNQVERVTFNKSNNVSSTSTDKKRTTVDSSKYLECYNLMQDANAYALARFGGAYSSLSDGLISTGLELSATQKARYDTIMQDTYDAYKRGIAAYEAGDMDTFGKICDEVLNGKKYLNLDDLVDIIALNINLQGDYIKDSSNYSIKDGKLIIDGYTVDGLLTSPNYVNNQDLMSLIKFYGKGESDNLVLDIMQVPIFVTRQVVSPTNYTLVNNNSVYAYNPEAFKNKINSIKDYYCSVSGVDKFYTDYDNGKYVLKGSNQDSKNVDLSNSAFNAEMRQYLDYYYQSFRIDRSKVGYFDGAKMKDFLAQYDNGNTNIKVSSVNNDLGMDEYNCYNLMLDGIGFVLSGYERNHGSLSETLEKTYNVQLSPEQRARYDTIIEDTHNAYQRGVDAYESGHVSDFRQICKEILVDKKYLNRDDVVDIISINLNSQEKLINNSKDYSISSGKLVIDGKNVEKLIPDDYECVLDYIDLYNKSSDTAVLDIMRAPKAAVMEAINPTSFSIMTDGTYYGYSNNILKNKIGEIDQFFENSTGLNNLGYEKTDSGVVFYGFDELGNKQVVSDDNEDIKALSRYLTTYKDELNNAANSRVGNFDGAMVRDYLQEYSTIGKNMSK